MRPRRTKFKGDETGRLLPASGHCDSVAIHEKSIEMALRGTISGVDCRGGRIRRPVVEAQLFGVFRSARARCHGVRRHLSRRSSDRGDGDPAWRAGGGKWRFAARGFAGTVVSHAGRRRADRGCGHPHSHTGAFISGPGQEPHRLQSHRVSRSRASLSRARHSGWRRQRLQDFRRSRQAPAAGLGRQGGFQFRTVPGRTVRQDLADGRARRPGKRRSFSAAGRWSDERRRRR